MAEAATREKMADPKKIRFPESVLDELERIAQERGSSVNEVVRRYVDAGLARDRGESA